MASPLNIPFPQLMWLLFLGIATGVMLYQLVLLFQQYFQWPIQTEVSLGFSPLSLPAVTICNANAVRLSQASKLSCFLQAALDVPRSYQDPVCLDGKAQLNGTYDFSHLACDGDCDGSLGNSSIKQFIANVGFAKSSRESLKEVGHQAEDMILDCSIAGRSCGYRNFTHSLSYDYGNCFTLSLPNIKMTRSGPLQGLFLELNIESDEYLSTEDAGYGLRVVLHPNSTRPNPSNGGFTVAAGSEVFVGLRMVNVSSQSAPYGSCDDGEEYRQKTGNVYTIEGCRDFCIKTAILRSCNCTPVQDDFAIVSNDSFCSTAEDYACMISFYVDYYNALNNGMDRCTCTKPCSESVYQAMITSRTWPLFDQLKQLETFTCENNPDSPKCNYSNENFTFDTYELRRSSFMRLQVYYERLNYEIVTEKPAYEIEKFLSDIGGTLGLWIGASMLGLGELLELVILLLVRCHRNGITGNKIHVSTM
ncbi:amiloride-sensitive sodium channel subunit beta-like isoform X2 [Pomacea canaliculata]|uniref:amiloride-sensitive sodium channel subunit beta-like isoform X2 n=1 Tax=Pomacea canaliculata TaxID=400727 RepID=UPI000D72DB5E|nr:amiloride-sensitive sodium channel subunit beta-like isoform X2 [Pomacea canaliculata]